MLRIRLRAEARRDFVEAREYIEAARPGYGDRFAGAVDRELAFIAEFPELARRVFPEVRRRPVQGWPYSIIFGREGAVVVVIAIAHHRRAENYWLSRLR